MQQETITWESVVAWCAQYDLFLLEEQKLQFTIFADLLYQWNRAHNLTRIPRERFWSQHILDSLSIACLCKEVRASTSIVDIGTGAGFPGVPLALACPQVHWLLVDSSQKRVTFLEQVVARLSLPNVTPLHARIEDLPHTILYAQAFDAVVTRAVAAIPHLIALSRPLLSSTGSLYCIKSPTALTEVDAVSMGSAGLCARFLPYTLPDKSSSDYVVVIPNS